MLNPSKQNEPLNSPVERASKINDPQFENQQGYFPYDLTHCELVTPRYGEITPTMNIDTVPGDRIVVRENSKLIKNQINGNFLGTINQYSDSFFVSLRNVLPNVYERLLPNPTKGEDIPNTALPQVPFADYIQELIFSRRPVEYVNDMEEVESGSDLRLIAETVIDNGSFDSITDQERIILLGRLALVATILSRGQLLDYLGLQFDEYFERDTNSSILQKQIDEFFAALYDNETNNSQYSTPALEYIALPLTKSYIDVRNSSIKSYRDLSSYRQVLSDILESGKMPLFTAHIEDANNEEFSILANSTVELLRILRNIFAVENNVEYDVRHIDDINSESNPFANGRCINIGKVLAYQQVVAQYYTNDHVDNIYSAELFMQNLRSVMFPTEREGIITREPVYEQNGVHFEYDYISYGGFWSSLISDSFEGVLNRQFVFGTLMFLMRRSLRYGDYFATARPNILAVTDQLGINVEDGKVSPIDVTKNLLLQRFLNSANYVGAQYLQYFSSIYGVRPSDTGVCPRFISHRKIEIGNQITNNTADQQGAQTTNLVAFSDGQAMDVFIDDFGYLITLMSFDTLPIYKSGIDSSYHFADRFDYFNPMLQNIGDQPIRESEMLGDINLYDKTFGYTMRNAEYKFKLSKAHGAFCNELPGWALTYRLDSYFETPSLADSAKINPDFIREKPEFVDRLFEVKTGYSPAEYYHFTVSCLNEVRAARKIQATPPVLF